MAAIDKFASFTPGLDSPAGNVVAVTPIDTANLAQVTRALYIGGAGNVQITDPNGNETVLENLAVGVVLPIRASKIWNTNTTATDIVALW